MQEQIKCKRCKKPLPENGNYCPRCGASAYKHVFTDDEILEMDRVLPTVAAEYLGETAVFIRLGLQQSRLPFGSAVQNPGGKWSYNISPGLLVAYKRGTLKIKMQPCG